MIGQAYNSENVVWWEIDESQIPGGTEAGSLSVSSDDVGEKGDCLAVGQVEAPPVVFTPRRRGLGDVDRADLRLHASECVSSPDGSCIWTALPHPMPPPAG